MVYLCGLRQNRQDRSHVAFQNMGTLQEGKITLRTTAYSGGPAAPGCRVMPAVTLDPGGFRQLIGIQGKYAPGTTQDYVRVRKTAGDNPFLAYGVINDGGVSGQRSGDRAYLLARR